MSLPPWASFSKVKVVYKNEAQLMPYIEIKDLSTSDTIPFFMSKLKLTGKYQLYICTPYTTWNITNENLSMFLPHVVVIPSENQKINDINSYLELKDDKTNPKNKFSIPICSFQGEYIMEFKCSLHYPFKFIDICYSLSNMFDIDCNQIVPTKYTGEKIEDEMPIELILNQQIYIAANLSERHIKSARKRYFILDEFIKNELNYCQSLDLIDKHIIPFIRNSTLLNARLETILETFFMTARIIHQGISEEFQQNGVSFFATFGTTLIKLSNDLNSYNDYVTIFPIIKDLILKQREKNPQFAESYKSIESLPDLKGLEIISLLVRPIQRAPNYRSLIQRLLEATPPGHPDYCPLIVALEKMNDARRLQDACEMKENSNFNLAKALPKYCLPHDEYFVACYDSISSEGTYYRLLLSNSYFRMLYLTNTEREKFQYIDTNVKIIEKYIQIKHPNLQKPMQLEFKSEKFAAEFYEEMQETALMNGRTNSAKEPGLRWKHMSFAPQRLQRSAAVFANGKFIVIGGRDECGVVSNKFMIFDGENWSFEEMHFAARHDCCAVLINDSIYVYGGEGPSGALGDFWVKKDNEWTQLEGCGLSGAGLAMCSWRNKGILLTGGQPFKTFYYELETNTWTEIAINADEKPKTDLKPKDGSSKINRLSKEIADKFKVLRAKPINLMHHSMHEVGRKVYIVGGIDNTTTYVLTSLKSKWQELDVLGIEPTCRVGQCSFVAKDHIWFFGGAGSSIPFCLAPAGQWFVFKNEFHTPKSISFPCCAISDKGVYIFGGRTDEGISNELFIVDFLRSNGLESDQLQNLLQIVNS